MTKPPTKATGSKLKRLSKKEKAFAELIFHGYSASQAARKALGWKCERLTKEYDKAGDLARSARIKAEVARLKEQDAKKAVAEELISDTQIPEWDSIREFAYDRLVEIRDDISIPAEPRYNAVQALKRLEDPARNINLIWAWLDTVWRGYTAHCPCCHNNFPVNHMSNKKLYKMRADKNLPHDEKIPDALGRRLALLRQSDGKRLPHEDQEFFLGAGERHIVGTGAARGGKSFCLAMFCFLTFLIPGSTTWILGRIYTDARFEMQYLEDYIKGMFYPLHTHMYDKYEDKKSGEIVLTSRWGSEIRIKSGKAQGSITGQELDLAVVAEPAWVPSDLFEELRARMSSRLGRIIALGTPKGFGGFLHRMVKMGGKKEGNQNGRLLEDGWRWGKSLLVKNLDATKNPEYVESEIDAARGELSDEEFAAEFLGLMVHDEGSKFPYIKEAHCRHVTREEIEGCTFIVGIDQGERNFGCVILGYNGRKIFTIWEYFDKSDTTIKANFIKLNNEIPRIISIAGGNPENWIMTIFDSDPIPQNILGEMEDEMRPWKTDFTMKPKNKTDYLNWREDVCFWINEKAKPKGNGELEVIFDEDYATDLHDQLVEALRDPADKKKGWIIQDNRRGDHVPDAWLMGLWLVYTNAFELINPWDEESPPAFEQHRRAQEYERLRNEHRELSGFDQPRHRAEPEEMFRKYFNRDRPRRRLTYNPIHREFPDDS